MGNETKVWYKPSEIAKTGLIRNPAGKNKAGGNYHYVLNLIKNGKLQAEDYGNKSRPYFLIHKKDIDNYNAKRG